MTDNEADKRHGIPKDSYLAKIARIPVNQEMTIKEWFCIYNYPDDESERLMEMFYEVLLMEMNK